MARKNAMASPVFSNTRVSKTIARAFPTRSFRLYLLDLLGLVHRSDLFCLLMTTNEMRFCQNVLRVFGRQVFVPEPMPEYRQGRIRIGPRFLRVALRLRII